MVGRVVLSFLVTVFLLISLGIFSVYEMIKLSNITQKLYDHPFTVTNATKNIQSNLISMHRYMKDVVLSTNTEELEVAITFVNDAEQNIYQEFAIIFKYYLGNREDIQKSYDSFVAWKPIRDEVIRLNREGHFEEAIHITKNKGYIHVKNLNAQVDTMIIYAHNKAEHFLKEAYKERAYAIQSILIILVGMLLLIAVTLFLLVKKINKIQGEKEETLELLEEAQSIANIATWNQDIQSKTFSYNKELVHIFGEKMESVKSLKDLQDLIYADDKESVKKVYKNHLKSKNPYTITYRVQVEDSKFIHIEERCRTKFSEDSNALVSYGVLQDITKSVREKIVLNDKLTHDELTGVYNRAFFNQNIEKLLLMENNKYLGVVILDIDFFKKVNDTFGHDIGDSVLIELCEIINKLIREEDYLIRWGGEEFILLVEVISIDTLYKIIDKIRIEIQKYEFAEVGKVTCSFGITLHKREEDIKETFIRADEALYTAKDNGRNQVQSA